MREALARRIREAGEQLHGRMPTDQEREQSRQAEELEEFKTLLAQKIDINTRLELLLEAKYEHREQSPAVEFTIDQRSFVLLKRQEQL